MAPLLVLSIVTLVARFFGAVAVSSLDSWPASAATGLACMFVLTGTAHFVPRRRREGLVAIVPRCLGNGSFLVTLTGVLELLGALALLVPPGLGAWRASAAWCLIALLAAMFPANIYAAAARRSPSAPNTPLLVRTVLQAVYVAVAVFVALSS